MIYKLLPSGSKKKTWINYKVLIWQEKNSCLNDFSWCFDLTKKGKAFPTFYINITKASNSVS